ncbi:prepilin-type N-terminal cleavage/methylation domain-containing protein [Marinobacter nitratireducens]|uniref:prepilin-type N-terminal cleavage/methylation domain-containing protein n=1 Tax=Marinobacter nitratireducens TaxID=1137280 RepID=UPI00056CE95C|nr:prepilin-type N-terminal cleavage/methylation domain-containing protein [Marinobacter nitratireducens]
MFRVATTINRGFTLVELVVVIILVGTLSALGVSLFASKRAFSPLLASQQLASATLLAQQAALAGNAGSDLLISQTSDAFRFTVGPSSASPRVFTIAREGASLSVAGGLPRTLSFGTDGVPASGTNLTLTFSGDSTFQSCISSRGAVYSGGCQP